MIYSVVHDSVKTEMVDLEKISIPSFPPFHFDICYARKDNFFGRAVYLQPKAFLLKHVALDLIKVHHELQAQGYGLLIYDAYRPWSVTRLFYEESSENNRKFLANPKTGSSHNRGCAVDLSLYDLKTGAPALMPSGFDEMNEKAAVLYQGGDSAARERRDLLQAMMSANGFQGIQHEWWHFNHVTHHSFPVMNFTFEEILQAPQSQGPLLAR